MKNNKFILISAIVAILFTFLAVVMEIKFLNIGKKKSNDAPLKTIEQIQIENVENGYTRITDGENKKVSSIEDNTQIDNVEFDAFFLKNIDKKAIGIRGTCKEIGTEDTLYMELNVLNEGIIRDAVISVEGDTNFYLQTKIPKDGKHILKNIIGSNVKEIPINEMMNGTQIPLSGVIRSGNYDISSQKASAIGNNTSKYSMENRIKITGKYYPDENADPNTAEYIEFEKSVPIKVDWYGDVGATITSVSQNNELNKAVDEENRRINVNFDVRTEETKKQLIISEYYLEGKIPQLNGFDPQTVRALSNNDGFEYDYATRKFKLTKKAIRDEATGIVTNTIPSSGSLRIHVEYDYSAYETIGSDTLNLSIPVKVQYKGYNNESFTNPQISNVAEAVILLSFDNPQGDVYRFDILVGKKLTNPETRYVVSKEKPLRVYNGIDEMVEEDQYLVRWIGTTGKDGKTDGMTMMQRDKEDNIIPEHFIKTENGNRVDIDMEKDYLTTNVGIYFSGQVSMLGADGYIAVYNDDTNELIETFTKENWSQYNSSNPYLYDEPIQHVRIQTSATNPNAKLYVYNIKQLDGIVDLYDIEEFKKLEYIESGLTGYVNDVSEGNGMTKTHAAKYESPFAIASVRLSKKVLSTQATEKNTLITINAAADESSNQVKWLEGAFLLKMPKEILDIQINKVYDPTGRVNIISYELFEDNEELYIKIITESKTEKPTTFQIEINCDITPNPTAETQTDTVELYYYNSNAADYWKHQKEPIHDEKDINDNGNVDEVIGKATTSLDLISPNSLITVQKVITRDESSEEEKFITTLAPKAVEITKENNNAKMDIEITNNYEGTVSQIAILGRVPFAGNKSVITQKDLGSNFTAIVQDGGITIDPAVNGRVTIYYSEKEDATKDLTDSNNGWTLTPDFSKVKSYLIYFDEDFKMPHGDTYNFTYNVSIPQSVKYDQVSYSQHAIYFSFDTTEGPWATYTEPNKVGIKIAKKYELELIKHQLNREGVLVSNATYVIREEGKEEAKTRKTENGKLTITGLYLGKTYILKELKSPIDYKLNKDEIRFRATEENGELILEEKTDNATFTPLQDQKLQIDVEDEVKARLKINKTELETETPIPNVSFTLKGGDFGTRGRIYRTDKNGEILVKGILIGEEYTLEETKAEGYYLADPIKFTVTDAGSTYKANIDGTEKVLREEENIPVVEIKVENEKIPTFDLIINKISADDATPLKGVKFGLYKNDKRIGTYITDEEGRITDIKGLYVYENRIDQTYVLKEVKAPDGYAKVKDITFRVEKEDGILKIYSTTEEKDENISVIDRTENSITLEIKDEKIFKLVKKTKEEIIDEETNTTKEVEKLLPGVKFAIYDYKTGEPAKNAKGEILGEEVTIAGVTYHALTTNEKGEITAELPQGIYKAIEIETLKEYELDTKEYTFGIDESLEETFEYKTNYIDLIGGAGSEGVECITPTNDGGFIVGGYFGQDITLSNGDIIQAKSAKTAMLVKYRLSDDQKGYIIDWKKSIGGTGSNNLIKNIKETDSGEIIVVGYSNSSSISVDEDEIFSKKGGFDGFIMIYNANGDMVGGKTIGATSKNIQLHSVSKLNDGYIVGGYISSTGKSNVSITDISSGEEEQLEIYKGAFIIKFNNENRIQWCKNIKNANQNTILNIVQTDDNANIIVGGYFTGTITMPNEETLSPVGSKPNGIIMKFANDAQGTLIKYTKIGNAKETRINGITATKEGGYTIVGTFFDDSLPIGNGKTLEKSAGQNNAGMIIEYDKNDNAIWCNVINGKNETTSLSNVEITSIFRTIDNGYILGGQSKCKEVSVTNNGTIIKATKTENQNNEDHVLVKYTENKNVDYINIIGANLQDILNSQCVIQVQTDTQTEPKYIIAGSHMTPRVIYDAQKNEKDQILLNGEDGKAFEVTGKGSYDVILYSIDSEPTSPEIPAVQELPVYNELKQLKITTQVEEVEGIRGGNISGDTKEADGTIKIENPYEIVRYGKNSTKEITMTPDSGYEITTIRIYNSKEEYEAGAEGEKVDFTANADGTYTLPLFENMTGDKHIVVKFTPKGAKVIVHHYLIQNDEKTDIKIAPDVLKEGKVGEGYSTEFIETDKYTINTTEKFWPGDDIVRGKYKEDETIHVNYYYELKKIPLIVHHYIEGTEDHVKLNDNTDAPDMEDSGNENTPYNTDEITANKLQELGKTINAKYELVEIVEKDDNGYNVPGSATGNYRYKENGEAIEITYFYKVKQVKIITRVEEHEEKDELDQPVQIRGGNISGDIITPEGTIERENPYEVVDYGEDSHKEIIITPDEDYVVDTITENGKPIEFTPNPEDGTVKLDLYTELTEDKEIVVKFKKAPAEVIIHHYIYDETLEDPHTTDQVPSTESGKTVEDILLTGYIGKPYASKKAENVQANYEFVESTSNTSGNMTKERQEVIYYYKIKNPEITNPTITKEATVPENNSNIITKEGQKVKYTINYTATIADYIGKATVTIVDELPYEIDAESIANLDENAVYNAEQKTITWIEEIDVDTFSENAPKEISIQKVIEVAYIDVNYGTNLVNTVKGKVTLETPKKEKETDPVDEETEIKITKEEKVTKVWDHTNNEYTIPTQIKIQIKNGEKIVAEQILDENNQTTENTWECTFSNLPKYSEDGEIINYTINEVPVNEKDLELYKTQINNETKTIINTYDGPVISATKKSELENKELNYVEEGGKITYTITVKNGGNMAGKVAVKDTIPEGTTFVPRSIKVTPETAIVEDERNTPLDTETINDDEKIVEVIEIPAKEEVTVSFEVKANKLAEGTYEAVIKNTAILNKHPDEPEDPDKPEEEIPSDDIPEKKPNVEIHKEADPVHGSEVTKGDEITYKIILDNSTGKADTEVLVTDTVPTGTDFIEESIAIETKAKEETEENKVEKRTELTKADLEEKGIRVKLKAGETKYLIFKVIVTGEGLEETAEGRFIKNKATMDRNPDRKPDPDKPDEPGKPDPKESEEVIHKYVEPSIKAFKEADYANKEKGYVEEGDEITYTITVENYGDLATNVWVKDTIPEGTTFIDESIKKNDTPATNLTAVDLSQGIQVHVPAKSAETDEPGKATISFKVKANKLGEGIYKAIISNTAIINQDPNKDPEKDEPTKPVDTPEKKPNAEIHKEANPAEGSKVKKGDQITYKLTLENSGEADTEVLVKDTIPTGTEFIEESITIETKAEEETEENEVEERTDLTKADLEEKGIRVSLKAKETKYLIFKVTVTGEGLEETEEGRFIKNKATMDRNPDRKPDPDKPDEPGEPDPKESEEIEHKYVEPNITATKTPILENDKLDYVEEDGKITYVITVINSGDLAGKVAVKDTIPTGTKFIPNSIKVTPETAMVEEKTELTVEDLEKGIIIEVPEKDEETNEPGKVEVSFRVKANKLPEEKYEGIIENTAKINKDPENPENPDEPVPSEDVPEKKPHVIIGKESEPPHESKVTKEDKITYKIKLDNTKGIIDTAVVVKDTVPTGTTFVEESIKIETIAKDETEENKVENRTDLVKKDLEEDGIRVELKAGEKKYVTFDVIVNDLENGDEIRNVAYVYKNPDKKPDPEDPDEPTDPEEPEETEEVKHKYVEPIISAKKKANYENEEKGYVEEGEKIKYTITVENTGELAKKVAVKDRVPDGTTFVDNSIKVTPENAIIDSQKDISLTATELQNGIIITVPAKGKVEVSFEVRANKLPDGVYKATIENTAMINKDPDNPNEPDTPTPTITTDEKKANVIIKKLANPADKSLVKVGQKIKYVISLSNKDGEADTAVVVKDTVPSETTFVEGSIKVGEEAKTNLTKADLEEKGIRVELKAGEIKELTFEVTVNDVENATIIRNKAVVDKNPDLKPDPETPDEPGKPDPEETNEVTHEVAKEVPAKVIIEHRDKITGELIEAPTEITGIVGDEYTASEKEFDKYVLVEKPEKESGTMDQKVTTLTYWYIRKAKVIENHIDIKTNEKLATEDHNGKEGDEYNIPPRTFDQYDLVEEKLPTNAEGTMTKDEDIIVNYYYIKKTEVIVKYIDKTTGEEIIPGDKIPGHEGDDYTTEEKDIPGYKLVEIPKNKDGQMEKDPIEVIYVYVRPAKVEVNYIDIDTNKTIADEDKLEGYDGDGYKTEPKDIKYYKLVEEKLPNNAKGNMKVEVVKGPNGTEIVNDTIQVNYYYRKLKFNLKVDKIIKDITMNGRTISVNGDIGKIEINRKELLNTSVQITYKVKVINTGELAGSAKLFENIPSGTTMSKSNNPEWEISAAGATLETPIIQPGETKEYTVVLDWERNVNNVGSRVNIVEILTSKNEPGFEDINKDDDKDQAELIITVSTGETNYIVVTGVALVILTAISVVLVKKSKKEE